MGGVGKVCNRNVIIIDREGSIREAAVLMKKYHVGDKEFSRWMTL